MPRHVRRISAGSNTALPSHRESIFTLTKRGKAGDEILDNRSSFSGKKYKTKELRRHSDPLLYLTIPLSPDNATETKKNAGKLSETSVEVQTVTPATHNNENTEKCTVNNSYSRPRRKSSVVPVPFRIPESQKKKQPTGSKPRPLSFPPAKEHQGRIRSLQSSTAFISEALKETVSDRHPPLTLKYPSLVHNGWDMVLEKGKLHRLCLDDNTELEEEFSQSDFCSRAERIVQWMNFFGWLKFENLEQNLHKIMVYVLVTTSHTIIILSSICEFPYRNSTLIPKNMSRKIPHIWQHRIDNKKKLFRYHLVFFYDFIRFPKRVYFVKQKKNCLVYDLFEFFKQNTKNEKMHSNFSLKISFPF